MKSKISDYYIVARECSKEDLEKDVNALIKEGYEPLGACQIIHRHTEYATYIYYYQTMIKLGN